MNDGRPTVLRLDHADPGATLETLKATEAVVMLVNGFSQRLTLSILMNACAMVLCHICESETQAVEQSKGLRREIERCIRKNYPQFKKRERSRGD